MFLHAGGLGELPRICVFLELIKISLVEDNTLIKLTLASLLLLTLSHSVAADVKLVYYSLLL